MTALVVTAWLAVAPAWGWWPFPPPQHCAVSPIYCSWSVDCVVCHPNPGPPYVPLPPKG